jgi:hypothetical protein
MKTLSGTVVFRDIEAGVWVFEGDSGEVFLLSGGDRKLKKNGARVEVVGQIDSDSLSLAMVGPVLTVSSYRFL